MRAISQGSIFYLISCLWCLVLAQLTRLIQQFSFIEELSNLIQQLSLTSILYIMQRLNTISGQLNTHPLHYFGMYSLIKSEHQAILDRIESFCQQHLNTQKFLQYYERSQFPNYLIPQLRNLKIGQYLIPPPEGVPMPLIVQGLIIATLAAHDLGISTFLFLQLPLSAKSISQLGSEQQKKKYIQDLVQLRKICGWALTERQVGSNSTRLGTTFKKNGDNYILNGNKRWIGNGDRDLLIVYGNLQGQKRVIGALVQGNLKGVTRAKIENKYNFRMVQNCQIEFNNVTIDKDQILPGANSYKAGVEPTLKYSRVIVIWNTVGAAIGVYQQSLKVAKTQKLKSELNYQKLAKIMAEIQSMLFTVWRLSQLFQKGELQTSIVGMFKAHITSKARYIAMLGRQIIGEQKDARLMKALLDMQVVYTYEGTYDINTLLAGSSLTGLKAFT